jgi:hypothetical protein
MQQVSVGLCLHRPEMIPLISEAMRRHHAVFLEEPPAPGFDQMIRGELSIDDYLLPIDVEYPLFSRKMCELLQDLYAEGKAILQVEPFVESLLTIHEFFAEGHKPEDLNKNSIHYFSPDHFAADVGKTACGPIDDLFEDFRKARVGRGRRNISTPSRRTRLH